MENAFEERIKQLAE
jgi:tRNA A37 threonylcarbamoyltransferase TsaD